MTTYIAITDPETDPDAPLTATLAKKWRDNPIALAEGASNAPVLSAAWHPYNMVTANDGATGQFYNGAVVASVTTPTMEAGYDYQFRGTNLSHNNGIATDFRINGTSVITTVANATNIQFMFEITNPTGASNHTRFAHTNVIYNGTSLAAFTTPVFFGFTALTTFNFTWGAGNFDAGQIYMYRRRNYMGT